MMALRKDHDLHGRRRGRNLAVLAALLALVVLLFAVTIVKLGGNAMNPTGGATWGETLVRWLDHGPPPDEGAAGMANGATAGDDSSGGARHGARQRARHGSRRDAAMSARRRGYTVLMLVSIVAGMTAMAWAAVPLYNVFCRVTGFGGTPLRADAGASRVLDQTVTVRFDASTAAGMPWTFRPEDTRRTVHIGETTLAFFDATNTSDRTITGTATFNVSPPSVGGYFVKIDCFCFTEQTLQPGQSERMPVTFFVDPSIMDDPEARAIGTITLAYTFFEKETADSAELETTRPGPKG